MVGSASFSWEYLVFQIQIVEENARWYPCGVVLSSRHVGWCLGRNDLNWREIIHMRSKTKTIYLCRSSTWCDWATESRSWGTMAKSNVDFKPNCDWVAYSVTVSLSHRQWWHQRIFSLLWRWWRFCSTFAMCFQFLTDVRKKGIKRRMELPALFEIHAQVHPRGSITRFDI